MTDEYDIEMIDIPAVIVYGIKGGVGKTVMSLNLAEELIDNGYRVGLVDADVYSANIPQMLKLKKGLDIDPDTWRFKPARAKKNLLVYSYSIIDGKRSVKAVRNTGDFSAQVIRDGILNTIWDVDVLVIDMPAGSGDEFIAVSTLLENIIGAIVVTLPETYEDLERALQAAEFTYIPVIGVIENQSGAITECGEVPVCPKCGKPFIPFQSKMNEKICKDHGVDIIGRVPLTNTLENGWKMKDDLRKKVFSQAIEYINYYIENIGGDE